MEGRTGLQNKPLRKIEIVLAISAVAFYILCLSTAAFAEGPRAVAAIAPLSPLKPESRNGDYINGMEREHPSEALPMGYNPAIFDKSVADEMNAKFKAFDEGYQIREHYQLNGYDDDYRYYQANKELADWTIKTLVQWHLDHTVKENLEKQAKQTAKSKSSGDRAAAQTVIAISAVSKAIRGTTMNFTQDTKAKFKYDIPSGLLAVGVTSPIADASMDYHARTGTRELGRASGPEKMSFRLYKRIEELQGSTGVQYGLLSRTLNYGVNKDIVGPLSAAVNQAHNINDTSKDETVFRLDFGTRF